MQQPVPETIDILAVGPHPDDVEIGAAATLAKESAAGSSVVICDLTAGEMGTNGEPDTRAREAADAAAILGARARLCLGLPDSALGGAPHGADLLAGLIRVLRPRIVIGPWGEDRHPDHRDGCQMVRRAVFLAGLARHSYPGWADHPATGAAFDAPPHRAAVLMYYLINSPARPSALVDVSAFYSRKRRALAAYESQFAWRAGTPPTPLNDGIYLPGVEGRDASFGRDAGVAFAEGFVAERYPAIGHLSDIRSCR
jgi:bacillithiol biosynthesis deacetylase BshB1